MFQRSNADWPLELSSPGQWDQSDFGPDFLLPRCMRTRYNFKSKCVGIIGETFQVIPGIIQETKRSPQAGLTLKGLQTVPQAAVSLQGAGPRPRTISSKDKRKGFKHGDPPRGLTSSRSTAGTSRLAWSRRTVHPRPVPRTAAPGPGCCRRQGWVGRTPSRSRPLRPAARHSSWRCPARPLCPRTPWEECFLGGLCEESSGQTRGGRTKRERNKRTGILR